MTRMDASKFDHTLKFRVVCGELIPDGNAWHFRALPTADVVYCARGGSDAVNRAIRHHCQSMGVVQRRKVHLAHGGMAWRVTGTTGREIAFRVERNDVTQ